MHVLTEACWPARDVTAVQVLGHLGFDFEDENGEPQGPDGKRSPTKRVPSRGGSQYLSWGGTSNMSFEVCLSSNSH